MAAEITVARESSVNPTNSVRRGTADERRKALVRQSSRSRLVVWNTRGEQDVHLQSVGERLEDGQMAQFESNGRKYSVTYSRPREGVAGHYDIDGIGNGHSASFYHGDITPQGRGISQREAWRRMRRHIENL